jgi:hypothetical protein
MAKAKGIREVGYVDVRGHVKASGWLEGKTHSPFTIYH